MKNFRNLIVSSAFLLLCAAGAMAQTVQTDYDHNFNLARFKTFAFYQQERRPGDPLAASPINDRRIHDALATQLTANGLSAGDQPDFLIAYFVSTKQGLDIQDNRFELLQRRGSVNVSQVTEGTLIVIFADAGTRQEVWRGYASGTINPKDLDKDVNKAVTKLIEKFKKNQMGKN
jgi:predicted DNA-binding transcriptional regulator